MLQLVIHVHNIFIIYSTILYELIDCNLLCDWSDGGKAQNKKMIFLIVKQRFVGMVHQPFQSYLVINALCNDVSK